MTGHAHLLALDGRGGRERSSRTEWVAAQPLDRSRRPPTQSFRLRPSGFGGLTARPSRASRFTKRLAHLTQYPAQRFGVAAGVVEGVVGVGGFAALLPSAGVERLAAPAGVEIADAPGAEAGGVLAQEFVGVPVPE